MADAHVYDLGQVEDMDGCPLAVGVTYGTVTVGHWAEGSLGSAWQLGPGQAEEFARLFVTACWEAARQRGQLALDGGGARDG